MDAYIEQQELIELLMNSTGEGIYGIDLNGKCTFANPACVRLLGYESDQELVGRNMHALVHHTRPNGEPYPEKKCRIYQALRQDEGVHVDDEVLFRKDGSAFETEYWSYPMFKEGRRIGCVLTFVDITERRRAEAEAREADALVRLLMNSTGEGIYGIDLKGNCTFANLACVRLLGYEDDQELLGQNMHDLVHHTRPTGEPYPEKECRIYQALRQDEGVHVDDEVLFRKDGTSFPTEYWSYPTFVNGDRSGCVLTFVDITDRLNAEEEMRQTEKMAALGKMSAGLAHELNNPSAAVQRAASELDGALDALQSATIDLARNQCGEELWETLLKLTHNLKESGGDPPMLSALETADKEEELLDWLDDHEIEDGWSIAAPFVSAGISPGTLSSLANEIQPNLLSLALNWLYRVVTAQELTRVVRGGSKSISELVGVVKSYSHMDRAALQFIDVHTGIEDTLVLLNHKFRDGVKVVRDYDRSIPNILALASELNQVWTNLIDNAVDAMDGNGVLVIRTSQSDRFVVIEIEDDGPGIPEEIQSRIFDPFFTTKEVGKGTGLGLDVVRRIVTKRSSGTIDLTSEPGRTIFRICLPIDGVA
jgi:PAS domain S-box-containing protein